MFRPCFFRLGLGLVQGPKPLPLRVNGKLPFVPITPVIDGNSPASGRWYFAHFWWQLVVVYVSKGIILPYFDNSVNPATLIE
jgi:hypothetical protein